jgi:uncharacterized protein involved in exopolysaccharide biosynthesis
MYHGPSGFVIPAGEENWRRVIGPSSTEAVLQQAVDLLRQHEARVRRDVDDEYRRAQREAPPDQTLIDEERAEAAEELARYEAKRPERVEEYLRRIADALDAPRRG